jgi:hypothetical protein
LLDRKPHQAILQAQMGLVLGYMWQHPFEQNPLRMGFRRSYLFSFVWGMLMPYHAILKSSCVLAGCLRFIDKKTWIVSSILCALWSMFGHAGTGAGPRCSVAPGEQHFWRPSYLINGVDANVKLYPKMRRPRPPQGLPLISRRPSPWVNYAMT